MNKTPLDYAQDTYGEYDHNANRYQARFKQAQMAILVTGILAVLFVAWQKQFELIMEPKAAAYQALEESAHKGDAEAAKKVESLKEEKEAIEAYQETDRWLHRIIVAIPLVLSGLIAVAHNRRPGDKWVLLRGAAEAVKREVFRYRTRTGDYSGDAIRAGRLLNERVLAISNRLKTTEVCKSALEPPLVAAAIPTDGETWLSPHRYIVLRIDDQFAFYSKRCISFDVCIIWATIFIVAFGALGTLLGAFNLELWIPLATASAVALTTYLRYTQSEETLIIYNRTRIDLRSIRAWWSALSGTEQQQPGNFTKLVDLTERVLEQETAGWSQRMTDAMHDLSKKQDGESDSSSSSSNSSSSSSSVSSSSSPEESSSSSSSSLP